jgi:hypothetical protein
MPADGAGGAWPAEGLAVKEVMNERSFIDII